MNKIWFKISKDNLGHPTYIYYIYYFSHKADDNRGLFWQGPQNDYVFERNFNSDVGDRIMKRLGYIG